MNISDRQHECGGLADLLKKKCSGTIGPGSGVRARDWHGAKSVDSFVCFDVAGSIQVLSLSPTSSSLYPVVSTGECPPHQVCPP